MRTFSVLLAKELRELLTLQILGPLIAIIIILIGLGNVIGSTSEDGAAARAVLVDSDGSAASAVVASALEAGGLSLTTVSDAPVEPAIEKYASSGVRLFVAVPEGFGAGLDGGAPLPVQTYTVMTGFSFLGTRGTEEMATALAAANQALAARAAAEAAPGVPLAILQSPLVLEEHVTIGERTAPVSVAAVAGFIGQQTFFIPIVLFVVIVFASQLIATTIATEKENKTLETLLSYPIGRGVLVTSKMFAVALVALLAAGAYMIGMQRYMAGLEQGMGGTGAEAAQQASRELMQQLGLVLSAGDYTLLGLSLFSGILLALSVAIILGAFAESVKAVQSLLTPLFVLLMVPYLITMFVDLGSASPFIRWGVLAIPFAHPFMAGQNLFLGDQAAVWAGIAYQLLWFVVFAAIAARIFSTDRILTMKLALRRRKP